MARARHLRGRGRDDENREISKMKKKQATLEIKAARGAVYERISRAINIVSRRWRAAGTAHRKLEKYLSGEGIWGRNSASGVSLASLA